MPTKLHLTEETKKQQQQIKQNITNMLSKDNVMLLSVDYIDCDALDDSLQEINIKYRKCDEVIMDKE